MIDTSRAMGGYNAFVFNYGYIKVEKRLLKDDPLTTNGKARGIAHLLAVNSLMDNEINNWSIVHELGHVWDGNNDWKLSKGLVDITTQYGKNWAKPAICDKAQKLPGCNDAGYVYADVLAFGSGANFNPREDFANSFAAYVYPVDSQGEIRKYENLFNSVNYKDYLYYADYRTTLRWLYIDALIRSSNYYRRR